MPSADAFLQQLKDEGQFDSHGSVTLDPVLARKKLADHRFHHGVEGLLALVSASLLAGATVIRVQQEREWWRFLSDAPGPEPEVLKSLLTGLFSPQQPLAWRELGLAVNSLFPRHCHELSLEVAELIGWFEKGEWTVRSFPTVLEPPFRQRLSLRRRVNWWQWLSRGRSGDWGTLKARTRWSPIPVQFFYEKQWVASYQLDPPVAERDALALLSVGAEEEALQLPGFADPPECAHWQRPLPGHSSLRCQLLPGDPRESSLLLVYRGITLADYKMPSPTLRFLGVVHSEKLELDASRLHIVPGERLRNLIDDVRQWIEEGLCAWLGSHQGPLSDRVLPHLRSLFFAKDTSRRVMLALGRFPVIQLADESYVSLDALQATLAEFDGVHFAGPGPGTLHGRPLVHNRQRLGSIKTALGTRMIEARPFLGYFLEPERVHRPDYQGPEWAALELQGADWTARVQLPDDASVGNYLSMTTREGQPFWAALEPLFKDWSGTLRIFIEGKLGGGLTAARERVLGQLRQQLVQQAQDLLTEVAAGQRSRHDWHFCSLLSLFALPEYRLFSFDPRWLAIYRHLRLSLVAPPGDHPARYVEKWLDGTGAEPSGMSEVDQVISQAEPKVRPWLDEAQRLLESCRPNPTLVAWPRQGIISYGVGPKKMSEHYCYIALAKKHLNLGFYYGAHLHDPEQLLQGTGKELRHVKIRSLEDLHRPALKELIVAATHYLPRLKS